MAAKTANNAETVLVQHTTSERTLPTTEPPVKKFKDITRIRSGYISRWRRLQARVTVARRLCGMANHTIPTTTAESTHFRHQRPQRERISLL